MKGFTLPEVMFSLAIAGGVLLTALTSVNHHLSVIGAERDKTAMIILARAQMSVLEQAPLQSAREGTFAPAHPEITWRIDIMPPSAFPFEKQKLKVWRSDNKREVALVRYIIN